MSKRKIFSVLFIIVLALCAMPGETLAATEVTSTETATSVIRPWPYPGLPEGVQFEMKTDENGRAILATIYCANSSTMNLLIKIVGGVVYAETSPIYGSQSANAVAESKLIEGKYDLPAHSRVVIAHVTLPIRPIISSPATDISDAGYPIPILPFSDWVVRAKMDVVPVVYPIPMPMITEEESMVQPVYAGLVSDPSNENDVHCLGYPVCYEQPVTVIVEDTLQMDYRWNRLDAIMSAIKKVNSNVVSTQGIVSTVSARISTTASAPVENKSKPTSLALARPSR